MPRKKSFDNPRYRVIADACLSLARPASAGDIAKVCRRRGWRYINGHHVRFAAENGYIDKDGKLYVPKGGLVENPIPFNAKSLTMGQAWACADFTRWFFEALSRREETGDTNIVHNAEMMLGNVRREFNDA